MATDLMRLLTGEQGSMGIVIWASIRCDLIRAVHKYVFVSGRTIEELVEFCYKLERIRLSEEIVVVNSTVLDTYVPVITSLLFANGQKASRIAGRQPL